MDTTVVIVLLTLLGGGLIFAEFFVPGGILGIMGGLALVSMCVVVFIAHGWQWGVTALLGSAGVGVLYMVLFICFFQQSPLGRYLTLRSAVQGQGVPELSRETWVGKRGEAVTPLRPVGKALIDGQRVEVQAESGLIPLGRPVQVVRVASSRLLVREVEPETPAAAS